MGQENIEVIKEMYAAFFRRDMAAIQARLDEGFEVVQSAELPWGGSYKGAEGLLAFFGKLTGALNNEALPISQYLDAGDCVVAIGRTQGTVRANGAKFDVPLAHVWQVRGGKAVSFRPYIDNPTMLAALKK